MGLWCCDGDVSGVGDSETSGRAARIQLQRVFSYGSFVGRGRSV